MNAPRGSRFGQHGVSVEPLEPRTLLASIAWDGGGDGQSLLDPLNWAGDVLPGASDDAVIGAGAGDLTLSGGTLSVGTITCDASASLTLQSGGELSVAQASSLDGTLHLSGGTLSGDGDLTLASLDWTSGALEGDGGTTVGSGDSATLSTGANKYLRRDFRLGGQLTHTGGALRFGGATLLIDPGATFTSNGVAPMIPESGTNLVASNGVFRKLGTATLTIDVPFNSAGTLSLSGGIVNIDAGGTNTGVRNVGAGATLNYRDSYVHDSGSTLSGGGTTNWTGGTQTVAGDWAIASGLNLAGAVMDGAGTLTIAGRMSWLSGVMSGPGLTFVASTGRLALQTTGSKLLGRDIFNGGTLHWLNGFLSINDADITNAFGKTFVLGPGGNVNLMGGTSTIHNAGLLKKITTAALTFTEFNGGVTLENTGTLDVRAGTLSWAGAVLQASGPALSGGTWQVGSGATLDLPGSPLTTVGAGATLILYGHFSPMDAVDLNLGTITVGRGGVVDVGSPGGTFTNLGTINVERNGLLSATSAFTNSASGVLHFDVAGSATGLWGRLQVTALASLGGTVMFDFVGSYSPPAGTSIQFLVSASSGGTFTTATIPSLPGRVGSVVYAAGGCRLAIN